MLRFFYLLLLSMSMLMSATTTAAAATACIRARAIFFLFAFYSVVHLFARTYFFCLFFSFVFHKRATLARQAVYLMDLIAYDVYKIRYKFYKYNNKIWLCVERAPTRPTDPTRTIRVQIAIASLSSIVLGNLFHIFCAFLWVQKLVDLFSAMCFGVFAVAPFATQANFQNEIYLIPAYVRCTFSPSPVFVPTLFFALSPYEMFLCRLLDLYPTSSIAWVCSRITIDGSYTECGANVYTKGMTTEGGLKIASIIRSCVRFLSHSPMKIYHQQHDHCGRPCKQLRQRCNTNRTNIFNMNFVSRAITDQRHVSATRQH